jgi:serine/threonine-protein kinase
MPIADPQEVLTAVQKYHLMEEAHLAQLTPQFLHQFSDPADLLQELVNRSWLSPLHAERVFDGQPETLKVGPYILLEQLGEGGMGLVYKAKHKMMKRIAVLKLIRSELKGNEKVSMRFGREIQAAARLQHPNIVAAYEAGEADDGTEYFAMEYVDGIDLGQHVLKNGPCEVMKACDYIRQAALGLQHAHESGLIHRDIKPDNLLLGKKDGVVKLLDLGLCRVNDPAGGKVDTALTMRGTALGTPEYMAPEQIRDSTTVDIRADLYSLGCTFYYLLAGKDAFQARTPTEVMYMQIRNDPTPITTYRNDVPPNVVAILKKLMEKKPQDRYQTPAEVAQALSAVLGNTRPASSPAAKVPENARRGSGTGSGAGGGYKPPPAAAAPSPFEPQPGAQAGYQPQPAQSNFYLAVGLVIAGLAMTILVVIAAILIFNR